MSKGILKTKTQIARALGVSRDTVKCMERAGCPFPAGKCAIEWALEWLKDNPTFRPAPRPRRPKPATAQPGLAAGAFDTRRSQ